VLLLPGVDSCSPRLGAPFNMNSKLEVLGWFVEPAAVTGLDVLWKKI